LGGGAIAGIVIGVLICCALCVVGLFFVWKNVSFLFFFFSKFILLFYCAFVFLISEKF
jgi:hypothetical protein